MREIDGTLSRLGTDYLDLYIIHRFDFDTPIIGATKASYLDDAAGALNVKLTACHLNGLHRQALEDIAYLEEMYVPHPIVGAIDHNPAQGVMLLDEKK